MCRNGDIITCASVRTGFKCAIYHENKWETIETPKGIEFPIEYLIEIPDLRFLSKIELNSV